MGSYYGKNIRISLFGESHSPAIGVVIDGLPAGHSLDMEELAAFMARRAPGSAENREFSTKRREPDQIEILSGLKNNVICGSPLAAIIRNTDTKSGDYDQLADKPRPGHADFTAEMKFGGFQAMAGGGHFSGRLTAPLCVAGGIMLQLLREKGIRIAAHISEIGGIKDSPFDPVKIGIPALEALQARPFPVNNPEAGEAMKSAITDIMKEKDSLGGIIECVALGLPSGLGDPMFEGMENRIAGAIFAIPAVRGIEFGLGFKAAELTGSLHNDPFHFENDVVKTTTNNHGGILGGITSGMPLIFRVAIKPTPSIYKEQQTVSFSGKCDTTLAIKGRHDPCIVPRAVPCVEAAAAIAIYDASLAAGF